MTPHQGAGAGQVFEVRRTNRSRGCLPDPCHGQDAYVLGRLLGQPGVSRGNIPVLLSIYDEIRRPVAQGVAARSLKSGQLHSFIAPELDAISPNLSTNENGPAQEQLGIVAEMIERLKDWRKGTTVEKDCQAAIRKLQKELGQTSLALKTETAFTSHL